MGSAVPLLDPVRFGVFELDLKAGELRKNGIKLKFGGQPFQILTTLLSRPGEVVTREELQKQLWPDTFVDAERNLNTAINKIREVLGDSADSPRFIETLPRRGYRFIAPTNTNGFTHSSNGALTASAEKPQVPAVRARHVHDAGFAYLAAGVSVALAVALAVFVHYRTPAQVVSRQRTLTRLTLDPGLQIGATWSPDGHFIAYSSNRGGKFDIWVQQIGGGNPIQVTKGDGQNWQPDWSPDGKYIAYRSERSGGGLYVIPALGGEGQERRIAAFGYYPRWSPNSSRILFQSTDLVYITSNRFYIVDIQGGEPHEVLGGLFRDTNVAGLAADWYPDGKRISVWTAEVTRFQYVFWTVPLDGGPGVKTEIPPDIQRSSPKSRDEYPQNFRFHWAPSGGAIYFELSLEGARNLWRMDIDPKTLKATGSERLTVGPGTQTELAISADGKRLAFTGASQEIRAWLFPFDGNRGRATGPGAAITPPGIESWQLSLTPDDSKLAIGGIQANTWRLWEKTIPSGPEIPVGGTGSYVLSSWSPDGTRIAYSTENPTTGELRGGFRILEWSSVLRTERQLTPPVPMYEEAYDWSRDGNSLLICRGNKENGQTELWQLTLSKQSDQVIERRLAWNSAYELYQDHFSPDGQWILFEAVPAHPADFQSALYVMPAAGGQWTRITDGKHWDDKPRWSPDGKLIYFLSERSGFFDLWAIRFDPVHGRPEGDPFLVKAFDDPAFMIPKTIADVDISITRKQLAIPLQQVSGGIWILNNVGE